MKTEMEYKLMQEKLYKDVMTSDEENGHGASSVNAEYAYIIVVPNPFDFEQGIKRDINVHNTPRDSVYWVKIGDGDDTIKRASQYKNPSQFISIIKLDKGSRTPEIDKLKKNTGKTLELLVVPDHICGGMHPGKSSSEWRAIYSSGDPGSAAALNAKLKKLLYSFFPLSPLLERKPPKHEGFRDVLTSYLGSTKHQAEKWQDVIDRIKTVANDGKGSLGKGESHTPKTGQIPRIYIVITPSIRVESRYTYLGMGHGSGDAFVGTYWVYIGYSEAKNETTTALIKSKFGTSIPSLSFNAFQLKHTLDSEAEALELKKVQDDLKCHLSNFGAKVIDNKKQSETKIKAANNQESSGKESLEEPDVIASDWMQVDIKRSVDESSRPAAIRFLNQYISNFNLSRDPKGAADDTIEKPVIPPLVLEKSRESPKDSPKDSRPVIGLALNLNEHVPEEEEIRIGGRMIDEDDNDWELARCETCGRVIA